MGWVGKGEMGKGKERKGEIDRLSINSTRQNFPTPCRVRVALNFDIHF